MSSANSNGYQQPEWPPNGIDETQRRIRAAVAYAGFTAPGPHMGETVLGQSSGYYWRMVGRKGKDKPLIPSIAQLRLIAETCKVPFEFFLVDYANLQNIISPAMQRLADRQAATEAQALIDDAARKQRKRSGGTGEAGTGPQQTDRRP